jgi:putative membrane protein insertion efficiency factor
MKRLAIGFIKAYRKFVSPRLPPGICTMEPTCSQYGLEAFQMHGFRAGTKLTFERICRCSDVRCEFSWRLAGKALIRFPWFVVRLIRSEPNSEDLQVSRYDPVPTSLKEVKNGE